MTKYSVLSDVTFCSQWRLERIHNLGLWPFGYNLCSIFMKILLFRLMFTALDYEMQFINKQEAARFEKFSSTNNKLCPYCVWSYIGEREIWYVLRSYTCMLDKHTTRPHEHLWEIDKTVKEMMCHISFLSFFYTFAQNVIMLPTSKGFQAICPWRSDASLKIYQSNSTLARNVEYWMLELRSLELGTETR